MRGDGGLETVGEGLVLVGEAGVGFGVGVLGVAGGGDRGAELRMGMEEGRGGGGDEADDGTGDIRNGVAMYRELTTLAFR